MATIAIVGGAGQVARHLHPLLRRDGHEPLALVRKPEQAEELKAAGVRTRLIDLESADLAAMVEVLRGANAVVFAAGGGPDGNVLRKKTVDLGGSLLAAEAAERLGITRFVQISAIGLDRDVPEDAAPAWKAYVEAKRDADLALRETNLDWTILCPGRLTDDEPTGRVTLGTEVEYGDIPRADVAAMIAAVVDDGRSIHQQWDLVSGQTSIDEAVTAVVTR